MNIDYTASRPEWMNLQFKENELRRREQELNERPILSPWQKMDFNKINFAPANLTGASISSEMQSSPWLNLSLQQQRLGEKKSLNENAQQAASSLAQARSQLSMRGGLRTGALERISRAGINDSMLQAQNIRSAGAMDRTGAYLQGADIASRIGQFNAGNQQQSNILNTQARIADMNGQRAYDLERYREGMKGYAANKTAEAY